MRVAFTVTVVAEIALRETSHMHVYVTSRVASLLNQYYASVLRIPLFQVQVQLLCRPRRTVLTSVFVVPGTLLLCFPIICGMIGLEQESCIQFEV